MKVLRSKPFWKHFRVYINMAKNNRNFQNFEEDDNYYDRSYYQDLKQRRQMKRMKNALKTRNIDVLVDFDDD